MKKKTLRWIGFCAFSTFLMIVGVVFCPGLNFSVGHSDYIGMGRASTEGYQACGILIFNRGIGYEWYDHDYPEMPVTQGYSTQLGQPYYRIGNMGFMILDHR